MTWVFILGGIPQKHAYLIPPRQKILILITVYATYVYFTSPLKISPHYKTKKSISPKSFNPTEKYYIFFICSIGYILYYLYIFFCSYFLSRQSYIKQKTPNYILAWGCLLLIVSGGTSFNDTLLLVRASKLLLIIFLIVFLLLEELLCFLLVEIVIHL